MPCFAGRRTAGAEGAVDPCSYESLRDKFDASVAMAKTLGADTVVLPFMTNQHRTEEGWNARCPISIALPGG